MVKFSLACLTLAILFCIAEVSAKSLEKISNARERREITTLISDLAGQFFRSGGQQGVNELDREDDKMGVLKRYLGSAIAGAIFGNGNDLISSILGFGSKGSKSSGSGSRGSDYGTSNSGSYAPISTSKTGISVIDSRPGERRPPPASNRGSDFETPRRGSVSGGSIGYDDEDTGVSSARRGSASRGSDTTGSSRRGSSYSNSDADYQPQAGSNSKTGVSIINSRPGDRSPSAPRSSSRDRATTVSSNREFPDYEAGEMQGDMASRTKPDGALGGGNRGIMAGHGNFRSDADRLGDNRRGNADESQAQGTLSGDSSRGSHSKSQSDAH